MKKKDYVRAIADKTGFTQIDIRTALDAIKDVVIEGMINDEEIPLLDGIKLSRIYKESRIARNPQTGGNIEVPAKYIPKCKFSGKFKEAVK